MVKFVNDARHVKHSILEDFYRDFLFGQRAVARAKQDGRNGIVAEPSVVWRRLFF